MRFLLSEKKQGEKIPGRAPNFICYELVAYRLTTGLKRKRGILSRSSLRNESDTRESTKNRRKTMFLKIKHLFTNIQTGKKKEIHLTMGEGPIEEKKARANI